MSRVTCYNADGEILKTLFQWDVNQTIEVSGLDVESAPNFHFCNRFSKEALVVVSAPSDVGYAVKIPNILLQQAETITAYIYQADQAGGFRTASVIYIPVTCRPRPDDYVYDNNIDYISLTQCSARLSAIERLLAQGAPEGGGNTVHFGEEEPVDAKTGDFWYDESEGEEVTQPLTFTGAVEAVYDGSHPVVVEIPTGSATKLLVITIDSSSGFNRASHTATEIHAFVQGGGHAVVIYHDDIYNPVTITPDVAKFTNNVGTVQSFMQTTIAINSDGAATHTGVLISSMKNPNPLTFTGAIDATYDGSNPVEVEIPKPDMPRIEAASTDTTATIEPNALYIFPEMASLDITLGGTIDTGIVQEYRFRFTSGATATTLTLPSTVVGEISVEANKVYEVSILDGYLVSQSWEVA